MNKQSALALVIILMLAGVCHAQENITFPVSGRVLMPNSSPAVNATIEARSINRDTDWKTDATAVSGSDGKFALQLPTGSYQISAVSGEYVYLNESEMIDIKADGSLSKPIEMRLEKGCRVAGSVVDISTGKPLSGVRIITREGDSVVSSDSGKWGMVLCKRNQTIIAIKDGYWWPIVNFSAAGDKVRVEVETKPGGTIKGRIINEQGQPVTGADIWTENAGYFRIQRAKTDSDGRFMLAGQDPDSKISLSVSADGYDGLFHYPISFTAGQHEIQVELTMKKEIVRTITGRVTRQDGSPVEGAKVAYGYGISWVDYTSTKTDKDGRYILEKANAGKNIVVVSCSGLAPEYKPVEADIDAKIDFRMKPGHTVEGRVEDDDGNPLAGVYLAASMETKDTGRDDNLYEIAYTRTDKGGKFKLADLPEGCVYTYIGISGYDELRKERLKVDRKDYILVLKKTIPGQICGTVVQASDGKPVPKFNVRLDFSQNATPAYGISPGLINPGMDFQSTDGKFIVKGLHVKDNYKIIITVPGYMQASVDPVTVKPASEANYKSVIVRLRPSGSFAGIITEAGTNNPIKDVLVTAWDTGSYGSNTRFTSDMNNTSLKSVSTRTDADGNFHFDSMPFTSGAIMLEKQDYAKTLLRNVRFSHLLKASMEKPATIIGSITDEQGKVPPGARINIENVDLNYGFYKTTINPDGSFKLTDLPPGEYLVLLYTSRGNAPEKYQSFDLKTGKTYRVNWADHGSVVVKGKVLQGNKPVSHAGININSNKPGMNWVGSTETGEDGSYKLSLRKPGTYYFSCMLGEWKDLNKINSYKTLQLVDGKNQLNFNLPYGSVSGKLVDKKTGKPLAGWLVRMYVRGTYQQERGRDSLYFSAADPTWWQKSECKTDKNGAFQAGNLQAGKWIICAVPNEQSGRIPSATVNLADGETRSGIVAGVPPTGSVTFVITGMKSLPKGVLIACVDEHGIAYYPKYSEGTYSLDIPDLPVGKFKAIVQSNKYIPTEVSFQVKQDETTNVPIKLVKGPRIIFKPKSDDTGSMSVAFRITTPDGKPVLRSVEGRTWGDIIGRTSDFTDPLYITVKPGTYLVKAAIRSDSSSWFNETDLNGWSGTVKIMAGKDTVIEIPWSR